MDDDQSLRQRADARPEFFLPFFSLCSACRLVIDRQTFVLTPPAWRRATPFRLHDVDVHPASNEITAGGARLRLKPRQMEVLLRLAASPGQIVTRQMLLDDVWPRRMVNDDVLSRVIADLRDALGDDARGARYIETLPKVGYRLIAPLTAYSPDRQTSEGGAAHPGAASPITPQVSSRAPFGPASGDAVAAPPPRRRWTRRRIAGALVAGIALAALVTLLVPREPPSFDEQRVRLEAQLARSEPFSSESALELRPRFSPDGRRIAYALATGSRAQIVVRDVASGERQLLGDPDEANLTPVFYPDGRRIAYFRRSQSGDCSIVAAGLDGSAAQTLLDCARRPHPGFDLAPDGSRIAFVAVTRPLFPAGIIERDLTSGAERVLTAPEPGMGDDLHPRYSPDGRRLVFFRGTQSHQKMWLVDTADSSTAHDTGSPAGLTYGAAWLGADGPLLVAADWTGQRALNLLDLAHGTAVTVGARGARFPDSDRTGNIVYENAAYTANLFIVDPQAVATAPRELWPSTRYTNQPEYSPDGREVVFTSNRDGAPALYVGQPEAPSDARRIALSDDFLYLRPHWAQDGRAIYAVRASRREDGQRVQQALRIAWPAGTVEVLASLGDAVFDVREADQGRALIVGEMTGNAARVWRTTPAAAQLAERLALPLMAQYQVHGNRVAFAQPQLPGLTLCDLGSLRCDPLPLPIDESNRFEWLLTGDALWYRTPAPPFELVRHDLARRRVVWRSAFAPTAFGQSIAVRPGNGALLVARQAPPAIDLMLAPRHAR